MLILHSETCCKSTNFVGTNFFFVGAKLLKDKHEIFFCGHEIRASLLTNFCFTIKDLRFLPTLFVKPLMFPVNGIKSPPANLDI